MNEERVSGLIEAVSVLGYRGDGAPLSSLPELPPSATLGYLRSLVFGELVENSVREIPSGLPSPLSFRDRSSQPCSSNSRRKR
jgi:hypothetical protein